MPTLESVYRDINAQLAALDVDTERIYHTDVIKVINDSIRELRVEYIKAGLSEDFLTTETVASLSRDSEYPFLFSATLTDQITNDIPVSLALHQSVQYLAGTELTDSAQTFSAGDLAYKDGKYYTAVESISNANTYNLTFDIDDVKNYYSNNGLKFLVGDIVYDQATGDYYRCDSEYTNNLGQTITASGSFTKLYWRLEGDAFVEGAYVPFTSLHEQKLNESINAHFPYSIKNDKIYVAVDKTPIVVSFIPEWTDVTTLTDTLSIPDSMVRQIKLRSVQLLGRKLGISADLLPTLNSEG